VVMAAVWEMIACMSYAHVEQSPSIVPPGEDHEV